MALSRDGFVAICDEKVKLVRVEFGLTQESMAYILGISKKTLVDIEKGRRSLGWTGSVAMCFIFQESNVVTSTFGGMPADIILSLAFQGHKLPRRRAAGRHPRWWTVIQENDHYIIQQNIISQHYRLLDKDKTRIASSFSIDELLPIFNAGLEGN
jgi:DNA-binding XRE family transcriptional regulator